MSKRELVCVVCVALAGLVACGSPEEADEHVGTKVEKAQRGPNVISQAERERRANKIRAHFAEKRNRLEIVHTSVTPRGQIIDWVPKPYEYEVPPPPPGMEQRKNRRGPNGEKIELAQFELEAHPELMGPEGTVPVVAFDVEKYLATVDVPPEDVEGVFPANPAPNGDDRYFATVRRFGNTTGVRTEGINVWDVNGPWGADTSIAQNSLSYNAGGSLRESVEAGKIEWGGDPDPYLFVYFTATGHEGTGYGEGGYGGPCGTDQGSFIQNTSTWLTPCMYFDDILGLSVPGGVQRELDVIIFRRPTNGNWEIWVNWILVGHYPSTYFSNLNTAGNRSAFFGELYDSYAPSGTDTDLGSGAWPSAGYGYAAYGRNMSYYSNYSLIYFGGPSSVWTSVTDPGCYDAYYGYNGGTGWAVNYWVYGGPGLNGTTCF